MGGTRALLASLGASISLVAGAALSLLVVSFVFAYDGLNSSADQPTAQAALLVDGATTTPAPARAESRRSGAPLVIKAPAPRPAARRAAAPAPRGERVDSSSRQLRSVRPDVAANAPTTPSGGSGSGATGPGDRVRDLGDSVSSTVQETGKAAGAVTEPLGPPVSQAVQKVLDLVESLLQNTTAALVAALDKTPAK